MMQSNDSFDADPDRASLEGPPSAGEPLEALRKAWRAEQAPPPSERLSDSDPATQSAIARMQQAWEAERTRAIHGELQRECELRLERSGILPPTALASLSQTRARHWMQRSWAKALPLATAAAILIWWMAADRLGSVTQPTDTQNQIQENGKLANHQTGDVPNEVAQGPGTQPNSITKNAGSPSTGQAGVGPESTGKPKNIETQPSEPTLASVPPLSLRPDGFEKRSGSVRLVLIQNGSPGPSKL